ncbi:unnamed protein product [Peniophora sp. CBMAI 1063]|nr:unnamed protein product [Peniophora sp. CBMAI 1063]
MLRHAAVRDYDPHDGENAMWLTPGVHKLELVPGTARLDVTLHEYDLIEEDMLSRNSNGEEGVIIYRAVLNAVSHTVDDVKVVVKVAITPSGYNKLLKEGRLYATDSLAPLQGDIVPLSYGVHRVTNGIGDEALGCLVLQDCGEPLESLNQTEHHFEDLAVQALVRLHDAGIRHNALFANHILDNGGKPFFVDFADAEESTCKRIFKDIPERGAVAPDKSTFGCAEIYAFCQRLKFWKEVVDTFDAKGGPVSTTWVDDPAGLAHLLLERYSTMTPAMALEEAYRSIIKYCAVAMPDRAEEYRELVQGEEFKDACRQYAEARGMVE